MESIAAVRPIIVVSFTMSEVETSGEEQFFTSKGEENLLHPEDYYSAIVDDVPLMGQTSTIDGILAMPM